MRIRKLVFGLTAMAVMAGLSPQLVAASQIEFVSVLESIVVNPENRVQLEMRLTPGQTTIVQVNTSTEIRDRNDLRIPASSLTVGDTLKVEGFFTSAGILAREVEVTNDGLDFELRGELTAVDVSTRTIELLGFDLEVPVAAQVRDATGSQLVLDDLKAGQLAEVEGQILSTGFVAREVTVGMSSPTFATVRFLGKVVEIDGASVLVDISGGVPVLVKITETTTIRNTPLAVGSLIEVGGQLDDTLAIVAVFVQSVQVFELLPDELHLGFSQTGRVDIVLRQTFEADIVFTLTSRSPAAADPFRESVVIPAGTLTASFEIVGGMQEARTRIDVESLSLPGVIRSVEVEVETEGDGPGDPDDPGELLEVRWSPDEIRSGGAGEREVRLLLTRPAPTDLSIQLSLKEGVPGAVVFPEQIDFTVGDQSAQVMIEIVDPSVLTRIRARLPQSLGGDTDDLEIEIENNAQQQLSLEWSPDDVELRPDSNAMVRLRLSRPAPIDFEVTITVKDGAPGLVTGIPNSVVFLEGQQEVGFMINSGGSEGRVEFRAGLPFELSGDHDDLKIEIER